MSDLCQPAYSLADLNTTQNHFDFHFLQEEHAAETEVGTDLLLRQNLEELPELVQSDRHLGRPFRRNASVHTNYDEHIQRTN